MSDALEGSPEEVRKRVEEIVQAIVPQAKCELHDYEFRIRCGLVDVDGEKKEFSLLRARLDPTTLENFAYELKARLVRQRDR